MLETWKLVRKYTHICSFRKYTFQYQALLNFADVSIFLQKKQHFGKNSTFTQSNSVRAVLEIFSSVFRFWRLEWVRNTKFGTNVPNEILLNAVKCQNYSFHHFWVIRGEPTRVGGGGGVKLPPPLRLGLYEAISDNWKPFKNDGQCIQCESSFHFWDIYIFVQTFWLCRKRAW